MAQELKKYKEPCTYESVVIETQMPHFIMSEVYPLDFKQKHRCFDEVILSPDLRANNNNKILAIFCLIKNLFLNF